MGRWDLTEEDQAKVDEVNGELEASRDGPPSIPSGSASAGAGGESLVLDVTGNRNHICFVVIMI